jgi:hypothetical protein
LRQFYVGDKNYINTLSVFLILALAVLKVFVEGISCLEIIMAYKGLNAGYIEYALYPCQCRFRV